MGRRLSTSTEPWGVRIGSSVMKSSMRKWLVSAAVGASAGALLLLGAGPANAATITTPAVSPSGGIVTVCSGTTANLDDETGVPLPLDQQQRLLNVLAWKCAHPNAPARGMFTLGSDANFASPMGTTIPGVGYLAAHLSISPGLMSWHTSASSMTYGPQRTLECVIQYNGGAASDCGDASGPGTSLTTRTNTAFCPAPGESIEVTAWLGIGRSEYYDSAYGVTE
jgi:hypothetical protein